MVKFIKEKRKYIAGILWAIVGLGLIFVLLTLAIPEAMYDIIPYRPVKARFVKYYAKEVASAEDVDGNFAMQTSYAGYPVLDAELFKYPYIPNWQLIEVVDDSAAVEAEVNAVCRGLESVMNVSHRDISMQEYTAKFDEVFHWGFGMYSNEGDLNFSLDGSDAAAAYFAQQIMANKISMETVAISDKSLLYNLAGFDHLRVELLVTVYEAQNIERLEDFFGVNDIRFGKQFPVILDFKLGQDFIESPSIERKDLQIISVTPVGYEDEYILYQVSP